MTSEGETQRIEIGQLPRSDDTAVVWETSEVTGKNNVLVVYIEDGGGMEDEEALNILREFLLAIVEIPDVQDIMRKYHIGVEAKRPMPRS